MGDERYGRGDRGRSDAGDYGRDHGSGRDYSYSSAREYQAAGRSDGERDRGDHGRSDYGRSDQGRGSYGVGGTGRDQGGGHSGYGSQDYGYQRYGQRERFGRGQSGGYERDRGDHNQSQRGGGDRMSGRDYVQQHHDQHGDERGFFERAGDEVRSWFGDDEAERRRDMDQRYDERSGQAGRTRHDDDYHSWRSGQMAALDRDYDEYRAENRSRFEKEFSTWRTNRQGQRDAIKRVTEHQEVVGSDGEHVGTVDKVKDGRILLTKNDEDAGGRHHSIPCSWITSVDDKVALNKSAAEAKQAWQDEDRDRAMSGRGDGGQNSPDGRSGANLNRSFTGTY